MISCKSNNPIRVVIVGAGSRAISLCQILSLNTLSSKAKVVAIADTNTEKSHILNKYFDLNADIYDDFEPMVEREDIDAVIISTPDYCHVAPALAAFKAHKNMYLEKPLATTHLDCDTMINAAKHSSAICYLGFNMRHSPVHEKIYELVTEGSVGKVCTIEANEYYYGGKTYFRRWNRLRKFGGGLWLTKACHDFDLITWIAGGNPSKIYATCNLSHYKKVEEAGSNCSNCKVKYTCHDYYDINKPLDDEHTELWRQLQLTMIRDDDTAPDMCLFNSDKDTFDNGIAVIDYDNDIRATYTVNVLAAKSTRQMRVIGTAGMIEADTYEASVIFTQRHTNNVIKYNLTKETIGAHDGADEKILNDFFDTCRNNSVPRSGLSDGRLAVQISIAAQESSDNNCVINLETIS